MWKGFAALAVHEYSTFILFASASVFTLQAIALNVCFPVLCISVYLVQFHDASWTFCLGAVVDAAEAEATAWTRNHESTALRRNKHGILCQ